MTSDRNSTQRTFQTVLQESNQAFELRQPLYQRLAELREGRAIISFFASFTDPSVHLVQPDADMVEEVLANSDCSKGISPLLNAPGGDGLAAERMIGFAVATQEGTSRRSCRPGPNRQRQLFV